MKKIFINGIIAMCLVLFAEGTVFAQNAKGTVFTQNTTYSKVDYLSDFKDFREVLEQNHGNLYESVKKETLDKVFEQAESSITDNMTLQQFYTELGKVINSINDGHTSLESENFEDDIKQEKNYLPLKVKFIEGKMYSDYINQYVPFGSEILEINDKTVSDVLSKLKYCAASENSSPTDFAYNIIEMKLPYLYPQFIENKKEHKIKFIDPKNKETKTVVIKSEDIDVNKLGDFSYSNYMKNSYSKPKSALNAEFNLTKSTAILRIYSFEADEAEAKNYVDKFFEDVANKNIKNIIFDVRDNLGGSPEFLTYILSYIYDEDFYYAKNVKLKNPDLTKMDLIPEEVKKGISNEPFDDILRKLLGEFKVLDDGSYYFNVNPTKPMNKNNFNGKVYVLTNSASFSCGAIFPEALKKLKDVYLVGSETGGNYYETTAALTLPWELPKTKIKIKVPLMQLVINDQLIKEIPRNSGVKPDYEVKLNYSDYMNGIDTQLNYVYSLIEKQR